MRKTERDCSGKGRSAEWDDFDSTRATVGGERKGEKRKKIKIKRRKERKKNRKQESPSCAPGAGARRSGSGPGPRQDAAPAPQSGSERSGRALLWLLHANDHQLDLLIGSAWQCRAVPCPAAHREGTATPLLPDHPTRGTPARSRLPCVHLHRGGGTGANRCCPPSSPPKATSPS